MDITPVKQEVDQFLYENQEIKIITKDGFLKAGDLGKLIKNKIKKLEDKRVEWTAPMLAAKKAIDDDFKEVTRPLKEFVERLDVEMLAFNKLEQARLDAEQKKLEAEALKNAKKNNTSEVVVPVVNDIKTQRGDVATITVKKTWTYEVLDPSLVPKEYLCVDEKKVKDAVGEGMREIAGIRIYQEESINRR